MADRRVLRLARRVTSGLDQIDSRSANDIDEALGLIMDLFRESKDGDALLGGSSERGPALRQLM